MYIDLIHNAALLVALVTVYGLVARLRAGERTVRRVLKGALFGGVAIAAMSFPLHYAPGIIYDGRSIILAMSGLFGGGGALIASALVAGAYRVFLGGAGMWAGLATIAGCGALGLAFRRILGGRPEKCTILQYYGFGLVVHVVMLASQLLLPRPTGFEVIAAIWLPVMLVLPSSTALVGFLLGNEERRIRSERELRESEERFRLAFRTSPDAVNISRLSDGLYVDVNDGFTAVTGYTRDEAVGRSSLDINIWVDTADRGRLASQLREAGKASNMEARFRMKDGRIVTGLISACLIELDGEPHILSITREIETIKETERALRRTNERLRHAREYTEDVIQTANVIFVQLDTRGHVVRLNHAAEQITGYLGRDLEGKNWFETIVPKDRYPKVWEEFRKVAEAGTFPVHFENPIITKSGEERHIIWQNSVLHENGKAAGTISFGLDITEHRRAEEKVKESEQRLAVMNRIAHVFLTVHDETAYGEVVRIVLDAVQGTFGMFGYIDQDGSWICPPSPDDVRRRCGTPDKTVRFPQDAWEGMWGLAMSEKKAMYSNRSLKAPGVFFPISRAIDVPLVYSEELVGNLLVGGRETDYGEDDVRFVQSIADYIEPILHARLLLARQEKDREALESRLRRAQRMESIGRLAGGIAHDFNNLLAVILGYAGSLLQELSPGDPSRRMVEEIINASRRSAGLTQQLLAFSRKQPLQPKVLDINSLVRTLDGMLRRLLGEHNRLELALGPGRLLVKVDPVQMERVLMNLAANARDAMPAGGRLVVATDGVRRNEDRSDEQAEAADAEEYVVVSVADTGCGMDTATASRIFEPFFTTKEEGKGTGLGLSTVYGIVKQSDGHIAICSEPGKGTTFAIYLPRVYDRPGAEETRGSRENSPHSLGHILVVEDEQALRDLLAVFLSELGYRPSLAANGDEALRLVEQRGLTPDAMIADMVMPGINGVELADRLMKSLPDLKVLFMTGYLDNPDITPTIPATDMPILQKPFTIDDLAARIRRVLGSTEDE